MMIDQTTRRRIVRAATRRLRDAGFVGPRETARAARAVADAYRAGIGLDDATARVSAAIARAFGTTFYSSMPDAIARGIIYDAVTAHEEPFEE